MQYYNSNQLEAVSAAAGQQLKMLRGPSLAGKATERKTWYKASMLWSASAKTKNPDAAIAWINWFANYPEAADIDLAERGIPPNAEVLAAGQAQALPCAADSREVHLRHQDRGRQLPRSPHPLAAARSPNVLFRHGTDVLFGRTSSADGAQKFVDELKSNLQGVMP